MANDIKCKQHDATGAKRGNTAVTKSRLHLIGWEGRGRIFLGQLQSSLIRKRSEVGRLHSLEAK